MLRKLLRYGFLAHNYF